MRTKRGRSNLYVLFFETIFHVCSRISVSEVTEPLIGVAMVRWNANSIKLLLLSKNINHTTSS